MDTAEEVIGRYFSHESIVEQIDVELLKEKQSIFGLPVQFFSSIKSIVIPKVKLVKTENYWFMDLRYKAGIGQGVLTLICVIFFMFLFAKLIFSISLAILLSVGIIFALISFVYWYLYFVKGLGLKVYRKEWVNSIINGDEIKINVDLPKYSKDEVIKYVMASKLLDFLGVTVNSAGLKIAYTFKKID